jgi:FkbM family methyltransferase
MPSVEMWRLRALRGITQLKRAFELARLSELPGVKSAGKHLQQRWLVEFYDARSEMTLLKVNGIELCVPPRFVSHYIFQEYEPVTQRTFARSLKPGMVVADVGAHIGYYSLLAARLVGESGKVLAFEPCEDTVSILDANVRRNRFENVEVHRCAVGSRREIRRFNITGSSDSNGFYTHPLTETMRTVEIEQLTLDEIIRTPLNAVKIDVEGAELEVLEGMREVLARNKKILLWVEWFPAGMRSAGRDPLELPDRLVTLGFRDIQVLDDCNRVVRRMDETVELIRSSNVATPWYVNLFARR